MKTHIRVKINNVLKIDYAKMRGVFRIRIDKTEWVKESDIIAAGAWGCLSQALAERQIEKSPQ